MGLAELLRTWEIDIFFLHQPNFSIHQNNLQRTVAEKKKLTINEIMIQNGDKKGMGHFETLVKIKVHHIQKISFQN